MGGTAVKSLAREALIEIEVEIGDLVVEETEIGARCIVRNVASAAMTAKFRFGRQVKSQCIAVIALEEEAVKTREVLKTEIEDILAAEARRQALVKNRCISTAAWIKFSYHSQKVTAGTITLAAQESTPRGNNLSPPSIPEGGLQVVINNEAEETVFSPEVTLTFRRNSDATKIAVSNLSDVSDTSIERIQDFKPWNLCLGARQQHLPTPEDCEPGTYTVYTRFYTEHLIRSKIVSDTIVYEKPEEEIVEDSGEQPQEETTEDNGGQAELQEDTSPLPLDELPDEEKIRELQLQFISLLKEYLTLLEQKLLLLR